MNFSIFLIGVCVLALSWTLYEAIKDMKNGKSTNGSQNAVTIGVLFTFIGISYSLYNFDVSPNNISTSVASFIDGMKLAFVTSVLGMLTGLGIKQLHLKAIDRGMEEKVEEGFANIKDIKDNLDGIKGQESKSLSDVAAAIDGIKGEEATSLKTIEDAIATLKQSVDANSIGALSRDLQGLASTLTAFTTASQNSQEQMQTVSESMTTVAKGLGDLNAKLSQAIGDMAANQETMLQTLSKNMVDAIQDSSKKQMQALTEMNSFIGDMAKDSKAAATSSQSLLDKTMVFQKDSVEFYEAQKETFVQNNASLNAMKTSFDTFLTNMAENYSKELINALNKTMEDLNNQLQTQFGDNFKELNAAVKDVVIWQDKYKEIVEKTTGEIQVLNTSFENFSTRVIPQTQENIGIMSTQLAKFTESADANIAVQDNLHVSVEKLAEMVVEAKNQIEAVKAVFGKFDEFTTGVIQATNDSMAKQQDAITRQQETMIQKLGEYTSSVLQTANDSMSKHQDAITKQQEIMIQKLGEYTDSVIQTTGDSIAKQQTTMVEKLEAYTEKENTTIAAGMSKLHDSVTQSVQTNVATVVAAMMALQGDYKAYIASMQDVNKANFDMFESVQERIAAYQQATQETAAKLDTSLQQVVTTFAESTEAVAQANEASAKKLSEQFSQSTEAIVKANEEASKKLTDKFAQSTEEVIKANTDALTKHQDVLAENLEEYTKKENELVLKEIKDITQKINEVLLDNADTLDKSMKQLEATAESYINSTKKADEANLAMFTDTKQYLKDYNTTTKKAMDEMGLALEGFKEDLKTQTNEAVATLNALFKKLADNTDKQQQQAVEVLAASLGNISDQMINNYKALISRIADLDELISRNNGGK